jgi:O-antigen ligase
MAYMPLAADKSLGVNIDLSLLDGEERALALDTMEAAGFRWLRQRFPWEAIEPARGSYDWAAWDRIVQDVSRHKIELIAVLDGSPTWARVGVDAGNPMAPPAETRDFGDFVEAFATRYGDWLDVYQMWEEPNIAPHWGQREIDPAAYTQLLREGAIRVRAADAGAVVLLAALAPNVELGGANMNELLFLEELYRLGAAEWFDVVAVQSYTFGAPPTVRPEAGRLNWNRVSLVRGVMEAHGDTATALWAASFGSTDQTQEAVDRVLEVARNDWPWMGPMLWAAWSPGDAHSQYALTDAEGQPSSAYGALQAWADVSALAWPGVYPADHPSGLYDGDWRVMSSGADIGRSGDHLTIPFQGTRLDLTVRRGDYRAFLFVTVDGTPANALPRDSRGQAYVVLYDPLRETETVTLARDLSAGHHTAEIVAERGWGQWAIVGWAVSTGASEDWPWLPAVLGLAAVVVLGVTVWRIWPSRNLLVDAVLTLNARYRTLDDRLALGITAGAAVLLYVMVGTVPTLLILALLAVLLFLRPEVGLPLIALALPFYQPGRPLLGKVFSMVEILTLLTAMGWAVQWGIRELVKRGVGCLGSEGSGQEVSHSRPTEGHAVRHASRVSALDWGVLALVLVGALSLLWAEHSRVAAREFRTVLLESAIYYGLLRAMVRGRRDAWRVADAWVLGGVLIALIALFQWAFGQNLITAEGVWRVRGFYGSPNNLALYLGRVFPLAVAVGAFAASRAEHMHRRRWAYGLAAMVMAVAILLTYSRGAWLLGVPAALLFLAAMRGRRTFVVTAGALVLLAVVVFLILGIGRLTSLLDVTEGTSFFRIQLWQSSWAMIRDHPVLGVGLDNFLYHYRTQYVLPTAWEEFNLSHPHNLVFDFWLRLGLPGLLVLVWLLVAFFRRALGTYRRLADGGERMLVLGLMGSMVYVVAHGLVDNAFFLVDLAFSFMLMLALVQTISDIISGEGLQGTGTT